MVSRGGRLAVALTRKKAIQTAGSPFFDLSQNNLGEVNSSHNRASLAWPLADVRAGYGSFGLQPLVHDDPGGVAASG